MVSRWKYVERPMTYIVREKWSRERRKRWNVKELLEEIGAGWEQTYDRERSSFSGHESKQLVKPKKNVLIKFFDFVFL